MPRRLFRLLIAATPTGDHVPDAELLRRFAATKDAAAFELLVRRHADAVWAACRRVLRNDADAEDAFQTTFLVLVRKAGSVRGSCVGGWLHRVAVNAALKLKARRTPSASEGVLPDSTPSLALGVRLEQSELTALVHQELARLPDRYRLPVVLCDLEGHTHAEAAKVLNWPVGSVSGRLSRAHAILRDRLTRRGVAGAGAVALAASSAPVNAISNAVSIALGTAAASPAISALTQGVLSAMRTANLKLTAAILAATACVAVAGAGTVYALTRPGGPAVPAPQPDVNAPVAADPPADGDWLPKNPTDPVPTAFPDLKSPDPRKVNPDEYQKELEKLCPRFFGKEPLAIEATDDTYRRLLKARLHQGVLEIQRLRERLRIGSFSTDAYAQIFRCVEDVRVVATELWANDPKRLIPWLEESVILAKEWEGFVVRRVEVGADPPQVLNAARRYRLEAEAVLWKAKNPPKR